MIKIDVRRTGVRIRRAMSDSIVWSSRDRESLLDRYSGSPSRVIVPKSWASDSSKDLGFQQVSFDYGLQLLRAATGDEEDVGLQHHFERAKIELEGLEIAPGVSAWDELVSSLEHFRSEERKIRGRLEMEYRGTPWWQEIQARWDAINVDATAVLRSVVRLYTTDVVYKHLNSRFRSGNANEYSGYAILLMKADWATPYYMGSKVYRGMDVPDIKDYEPGLVFMWPFFVSASASKSVAKEFGAVTWTVELPQSTTVIDIHKYSAYPSEEEVLFFPYSSFEVQRRTDTEVVVRQLSRSTDTCGGRT